MPGAQGPGPRGPVSQTASGPRVGRQYWDRGTRPGVGGNAGTGRQNLGSRLAREPKSEIQS